MAGPVGRPDVQCPSDPIPIPGYGWLSASLMSAALWAGIVWSSLHCVM
jgi:hypothetical protein